MGETVEPKEEPKEERRSRPTHHHFCRQCLTHHPGFSSDCKEPDDLLCWRCLAKKFSRAGIIVLKGATGKDGDKRRSGASGADGPGTIVAGEIRIGAQWAKDPDTNGREAGARLEEQTND